MSRSIFKHSLFFTVNICPKLTPPKFGSISSKDVIYGSVVNVKCDLGYKFSDNSLQKDLECVSKIDKSSIWNDSYTDCEGNSL